MQQTFASYNRYFAIPEFVVSRSDNIVECTFIFFSRAYSYIYIDNVACIVSQATGTLVSKAGNQCSAPGAALCFYLCLHCILEKS